MNQTTGVRLGVIAFGVLVGCKGSEGPSCARVAAHMHELMSADRKGGPGDELLAKLDADMKKILEAECESGPFPPKLRSCVLAAKTDNDMMPCLGAPKAVLSCPSGSERVGPRPVELDEDEADLRRTFEMHGNDDWEEMCVANGKKHGPYRRVTIADPESMYVREEETGAFENGAKTGEWKTMREERVVSIEGWKAGKRHGEHVVFDESGAKVDVTTYADDVEDGVARRWHHADQLSAEIHYVQGKQHGSAREWYEDGTPKSELAFASGAPVGKHREWHENGKPSVEGAYDDGERHGPWREFSETGVLVVDGVYTQGKKTGTWSAFRPDGSKLSRGAYVDDERRGAWTYYDKAGAVMAALTIGSDDTIEIEESDEGVPQKIDVTAADGTRTHLEFFADGGIKVRGGFKGEERHGPWTELDRQGRKIVDVTYKDGKKHGPAAGYHEDSSQLSEQGTMVDGEWDGPYKQWYDDGKIRMQGVYVAGKRDGLWTEFHPKGHKWREGTFRLGDKIGKWTTWDAKGAIAQVEEMGD